ncbi:MAG: ATP phosphoribosyltransferase [Paracoccaceae bacterium]
MSLKIGIPSKGRLMESTFNWFGDRGITLSRSGSDREYAAHIEGVSGVSIVLMSAGEVPRDLMAGRIHLGVTGTDLVREKIPLWSDHVIDLAEMGFGHADLILAVPDFWIDVSCLDDLDAAAAAFRAKHGFRMRIATKYHRLIREYLAENGVADYQIVDSQGATEGTVKNLTAEMVADITSTGETLRANHLKPLADGPILHSQATLFASRASEWSDDTRRSLQELCDKLGLAAPDLLS